MATVTEPLAPESIAAHDVGSDYTAADLVALFGPIPLWRIRFEPAPGAATEQDVLDIYAREKRLCELVDGFLVEKTVGIEESCLASFIGGLISIFLQAHNLGFTAGADGMNRLWPGRIRIPDLSFYRWERFPSRKYPTTPFAELPPDLAVEVLSPGNTTKEMNDKLDDYYRAGVRLVWFVDPRRRTVEVFTAARPLDRPPGIRHARRRRCASRFQRAAVAVVCGGRGEAVNARSGEVRRAAVDFTCARRFTHGHRHRTACS